MKNYRVEWTTVLSQTVRAENRDDAVQAAMDERNWEWEEGGGTYKVKALPAEMQEEVA